jgi:hypothetical protein
MRFTNTQIRNRLRLLRELEVTDIKLNLRHDELYDEYYKLVEPVADEEVLEAMAQVHADTGGHIKLEDIREQLGDRKFNYAYSNCLLKIEGGRGFPGEDNPYIEFILKGDRPVWSLIETSGSTPRN